MASEHVLGDTACGVQFHAKPELLISDNTGCSTVCFECTSRAQMLARVCSARRRTCVSARCCSLAMRLLMVETATHSCDLNELPAVRSWSSKRSEDGKDSGPLSHIVPALESPGDALNGRLRCRYRCYTRSVSLNTCSFLCCWISR